VGSLSTASSFWQTWASVLKVYDLGLRELAEFEHSSLSVSPSESGRKRKMRRWLLWLEGNGHRTCLAVQQQRLSAN
jgi:hypothetical protein